MLVVTVVVSSRDPASLRRMPTGANSGSMFTISEQECVPSETAKYNELFANPAAGVGGTGK